MFVKWLCAAAALLAYAAPAPAQSDPALQKYADKTIHWKEGVVTEVDGASMDFKMEGHHLKHTKGVARLGNGLSESYSSLSRHDVKKMHSGKFALAKDSRIFFESSCQSCCTGFGAGALDWIRVGDVVRVGYYSPMFGRDRPVSVEVFDHNRNLTREAHPSAGTLDPVTGTLGRLTAPVTGLFE